MDEMGEIWLRDPDEEPATWHLLMRWKQPMACGRDVAVRHASVWPVKDDGSGGPPVADQCQGCTDSAIRATGRLPIAQGRAGTDGQAPIQVDSPTMGQAHGRRRNHKPG
jgi:hypothetical protein